MTALRYPPGPTKFQLLFALPRIQCDVLSYLMQCAETYGDIVGFEAGPQRAYFLNHPTMIQHVLQDNHRSYTKNTIQYNSLASITGNGLLNSDGTFWFQQRKLQQPAFARPKLMSLDRIVVPACAHMLSTWEAVFDQSCHVDIDSEMMKLTLEIVGRSLFGIDLRSEAKTLTEAVLTTLDHIVYRAQHPLSLPEKIPTPRNLRFRRALATLESSVYAMINDRRSRGDMGEDMLGMLLAARDDEGKPMPDKQVRDEILTMLIAGHETVASALTWAFYLLSQHPEMSEALSQEAKQLLQGRAPTSEDLASLPFANHVFSETLRLYPPAWLITRYAQEADRIGDYEIAKGSLIILSPYVTHRHPTFWPDPEQFQPARFEKPKDKSRPRYAYIPFGGGPRLCIGNNFAIVEAVLLLAMIASRFRLTLPKNAIVKADALVTMRPHGGLLMKLERV